MTIIRYRAEDGVAGYDVGVRDGRGLTLQPASPLDTASALLLGDRAERVGALSREHQLLWLGATLLLGEAWQRPLARQ